MGGTELHSDGVSNPWSWKVKQSSIPECTGEVVLSVFHTRTWRGRPHRGRPRSCSDRDAGLSPREEDSVRSGGHSAVIKRPRKYAGSAADRRSQA